MSVSIAMVVQRYFPAQFSLVQKEVASISARCLSISKWYCSFPHHSCSAFLLISLGSVSDWKTSAPIWTNTCKSHFSVVSLQRWNKPGEYIQHTQCCNFAIMSHIMGCKCMCHDGSDPVTQAECGTRTGSILCWWEADRQHVRSCPASLMLQAIQCPTGAFSLAGSWVQTNRLMVAGFF